MPSTTIAQRKRSRLFLVLSVIFLTNAIIAELIGVKIFSAEATLGLPPAQIPLLGEFVLDFNLAAGVILWPVVFISTDIINEYFGKSGVKTISYLTVGAIAYVFFVLYITIQLSPADFWLEVNQLDAVGRPFDINYAFNTVYGQGLGIIIGSLVAFLLGQLLDVFVFQRLRRITGEHKIWLRATGSTLVSQLVDSYVVLFIAFYVFGDWPFLQIIAVGLVNYTYKAIVAIVLTPLLYVAHHQIDRYLGHDLSATMIREATQDTSFF